MNEYTVQNLPFFYILLMFISFNCAYSLHTVPTLSTSTNFLVVPVGESAQVNCTPSNPTAPVQWRSQFGEEQATVSFSPAALQHTAEFTANEPSYLTELYTCDLINVDEPDEPVDPQVITVRFISGELVVQVWMT